MKSPESPKLEACRDCKGSGRDKFGPDLFCPSCMGTGREPARPAPTASPALPPGQMADDVAEVLAPVSMDGGGTDFYGWKGWLKYQEAARRLAAHVQSQSSTIGGQRELIAALDEYMEFARTRQAWSEEMINSSGEYVDGAIQHSHEILAKIRKARAALKPVARGEAKATFDLIAHLRRQIAWSSKTFGPHDRVKGCSDHIRKELDEIAADPSDISERIDVVILALDLAWRGRFSPEEIVAAMVAKQTKNEARTWPDWRTADPEKAIEHDRGFPPVAAGSTGAA